MRLPTPQDTFLYHALIMHLRHRPDEYRHIRGFCKDAEVILPRLLQGMLEAGDIEADNLKNGLITDRSVISLK